MSAVRGPATADAPLGWIHRCCRERDAQAHAVVDDLAVLDRYVLTNQLGDAKVAHGLPAVLTAVLAAASHDALVRSLSSRVRHRAVHLVFDLLAVGLVDLSGGGQRRRPGWSSDEPLGCRCVGGVENGLASGGLLGTVMVDGGGVISPIRSDDAGRCTRGGTRG